MVCFVVICICFSVERLAFTHIVFWLKPCFSPIIVIVPFWITKWCFSLSSWNSWLMGWLSKLETWGWNQLYRQTLFSEMKVFISNILGALWMDGSILFSTNWANMSWTSLKKLEWCLLQSKKNLSNKLTYGKLILKALP